MINTAESSHHSNRARQAVAMGKLCSVAVHVRDGQESTIVGPRSIQVGRLIHGKRRASGLLRTLLPNAARLVGAGGNNLVFAQERGQVQKLNYQVLGDGQEELAAGLDRRKDSFQQVASALGDLAIPTDYQIGVLRFRAPGHVWDTHAASQPYFSPIVDAFSEPARDQITTDHQLRHEVAAFSASALDMMEDGIVVDALRPGNIVLVPGEHLRLIDVEPIPLASADLPGPEGTETVREYVQGRLEYLQELAIPPTTAIT